MSYLWDTCVISDVGKSGRDPLVTSYLASLPTSETYISAISVGEIEYGLKLLPIGRRRIELESVMNQIISEFSTRILPVTIDVARVWGELTARARKNGFGIQAGDGLIAATALHHGMHIVTRNVKHFEPTGVLLINPWEEADSVNQ